MFRRLVRVSLFSALTLAGCGFHPDAGGAAGGTDGKGDGVTLSPGGDSAGNARLTLQLPTGYCENEQCDHRLQRGARAEIDGDKVALNTPIALSPGTHKLTVNGIDGTITLGKHEDRTLVLPVMKRVCDDTAAPGTPSTDFGANPPVAPCPTWVDGGATPLALPLSDKRELNTVWARSADECERLPSVRPTVVGFFPDSLFVDDTMANVCARYFAGGLDVANTRYAGWLDDGFDAYPPGTVSTWVNGAVQTMTLAEGDATTFELALAGAAGDTFSTTLTFTDAAHFPDALPTTIGSSCAGERSYTVPHDTRGTLTLSAFIHSGCTYTLDAGGFSSTLSQANDSSFTLRRLEVDDVELTRYDGSTYKVKGRWMVYGNGSGSSTYETHTGIDLVPGSYGVAITYVDADGKLHNEWHDVTF